MSAHAASGASPAGVCVLCMGTSICRDDRLRCSYRPPGSDLGITDGDFVSVGLVMGQFRVSLGLVGSGLAIKLI